ncbi:asparagine synthase C-terminal domain-containing protein [Streptomyces sp. TRM 70351]|uniref:asparagine synthetase B family protein n=1 Tax=Streptomyces sp. TRM 70351 TaxID=3116552 RepID=UPI002E7C1BB2|nr:asparagine synthase C-terminal domain-containing protein [Streptomyces sp. TRM 70351]MEE1927174.1 asparagine synthase C-terminal domain-containing protein [Streptomyces sp. TRM 70351]
MARWCAVLTADDPAGRLAATGAEPVAAGGTYALGLVPAPGAAAGPWRAGQLVAVGEVTLYEPEALRARLGGSAAGVPPDCPHGELLLRWYARFGSARLAEAEGMYALAVVRDPGLVGGPAELTLIRDAVGGRTLFLTRTADGTWAAATALRALARLPGLRTGLDLAAVRSFLSFAYLPGRQTLLRGVEEALPGRRLRLRADGSSQEAVYWEPAEADDPRGPQAHAARLRELLEEATARRLPAGEPVGVLLSGGIDSSLVTALAARRHDRPVRTYSIGFDTETPDELGYSGLVAAHCGTGHRVLTVSGRSVAARLPETVALLDCPVGDPLTVPNLLLAEAVAADGMRVVLNGEGGDPVFGGPKNLPMLIHELYRREPDEEARARAYLDSYRKCHADLPVLLTPEAQARAADAPPLTAPLAPYLRQGAMHSLLNQLLHTNLRTKGAHHILAKVERITAASGLEGRAPLFDRAVVDHAFAVPPRWKLAGTSEKWILKEAVRDLLPATVVDRPKSGMRVPVQQWLRGPLRELAEELLFGRSARARGLFRTDTLRAWTRGEGLLLPRHGGKLWLVLTLELWLRAYEVGP